ncbi:DNA-directed RNA polymerase III subunit RPC3 [Spathaspora passalidarum NRRL Y-27907]|uniref:DNA-directed RNA polymerase III subunit RPC3 n=1 Tax=Spathaspora passalidarum (strain NRRL Y-27907 / 11-Y1) TaxID=619300 RepID=G3AI66_SPAPN|nr:DNA-directed RNA polymerase III subunit RPC3 [Spathaspora passalidarum NRRL Y-27907]EGW34379.1 DNA-directed RNA polymerase III subunit RPC3 [Spathaspora passalidarum NRRL Y-27907]
MDETITEAAKTQSTYSFLYTSIAQTHLGEVASCIISCLISNGRLTSKELSQRTKIPLKSIKSALVSLVQLNCVYYWTSKDSAKTVHYSLNESGLLAFIHSGDIIQHIKERYGDDAAEIIQNVLINGHVKVEDYLGQYEDLEVRMEKQTLFFKLFSERWLVRLQPFNFSPIDDIWQEVFQECLTNTPRTTTTSEIKRVAEAKEKAKAKLTTLLESGQSPQDLYDSKDGIKKLQPHIIVTFNVSRFQKHLRTNSLVNFAKSRIGLLTAKVYEAALKVVEQNSPELRHPFLEISGLINDPEEEKFFINSIENKLVDERKIVFNIRDVMRTLSDDIDLRNSILTHNFLKPQLKKRPLEDSEEEATKKVKLENDQSVTIKNEGESSDVGNGNAFTDNSDPHSLTLIQHHLKLLTSGTAIQFLNEISPGTFSVPYAYLTKQIKQYNFESLIKTTLGQDAFRILRCLKSMKLSDEKTISNAVLLKEKTVRNEIYQLVKANFVEIQEVPRSADRAASKTFFLFRFKEWPSNKFLLNSLIYSMAEIINNVQDFKADHKILLEKCEREDVQGHEEELLLESELKTLLGLQNREINNIGKFNRIKTLYDIFSL